MSLINKLHNLLTPMRTMAFPQELRSPSGGGYPYISFETKIGTDTKSIALYMPPGLTIADGISYNSINLGVLGSPSLNGASSELKDLSQKITGIGKSTGLTAAAAAMSSMANKVISEKITGEESSSVRDSIKLKLGKTTNPNQNMLFNNTNIRTFSFEFKMMAESEQDSLVIKNIVNTFRAAMYPTKSNFGGILSFPSKFQIKFYDGGSISPSTNLPSLIDCVLTDMSTVYNASGNMFFEDGSPAEVDVSVSFSEVRGLTRKDVMPPGGIM